MLPQHLVCLLSAGHVTCNPALPLVDSWSRDLTICALIGSGSPLQMSVSGSHFNKLFFAALFCYFLLCPLFIIVFVCFCLLQTLTQYASSLLPTGTLPV